MSDTGEHVPPRGADSDPGCSGSGSITEYPIIDAVPSPEECLQYGDRVWGSAALMAVRSENCSGEGWDNYRGAVQVLDSVSLSPLFAVEPPGEDYGIGRQVAFDVGTDEDSYAAISWYGWEGVEGGGVTLYDAAGTDLGVVADGDHQLGHYMDFVGPYFAATTPATTVDPGSLYVFGGEIRGSLGIGDAVAVHYGSQRVPAFGDGVVINIGDVYGDGTDAAFVGTGDGGALVVSGELLGVDQGVWGGDTLEMSVRGDAAAQPAGDANGDGRADFVVQDSSWTTVRMYGGGTSPVVLGDIVESRVGGPVIINAGWVGYLGTERSPTYFIAEYPDSPVADGKDIWLVSGQFCGVSVLTDVGTLLLSGEHSDGVGMQSASWQDALLINDAPVDDVGGVRVLTW